MAVNLQDTLERARGRSRLEPRAKSDINVRAILASVRGGSRPIVASKASGFSETLDVAGRRGRFNFNEPPQFLPDVGGGESPLFKFETEQGESFLFRTERDKQGGRWENAPHAKAEFNQMRKDPTLIEQFWGKTDVAKKIRSAINRGDSFEELKPALKNVNTHRQISGDDATFSRPLDHSPINIGAMLARTDNPDQVSKTQLDAMAVNAATGIPIDVAKRNPTDIKLMMELNRNVGVGVNAASERIKTISTIGIFTDETAQANAQKAKSDVETLAIAKQMHDKKLITDAEFERFKKNPKTLPLWAEPNPALFQTRAKQFGGLAVLATEEIGKGFAQGVNGTLAGTAGAVQWLAGDTLVGKGAKSLADFFEENAAFIAPEDPTIVADVAGGFGSMFTLLVPGAAVSKGLRSVQFISRGVAAFLQVGIFTVNESLVEAGSVYRERIAQTGSREDAESAARFVFFLNLPLNALTNKLGLFAGKSQALRSVITEGTQEAAQSVVSQIPTRERIDFAQVRHEALIGAIVGGGTGAIMQRASRSIEAVPELSQEAQQVYSEAEQAALDAGATAETADIAGTKALGATEEGQAYIEATADAMDAVLEAEAAIAKLEEGGAILPTTELTEQEVIALFESGATEEEIVATLKRDIEEIPVTAPERAVEAEIAPEEIALTVEEIIEQAAQTYPKITTEDEISGLKVLSDIPNTSSIEATFFDSETLPGIREMQMSDFGGPRTVFAASNDFRRSEEIAESIKESKEIKPLIIAVDKEGPYILEGAHRFVALHNLGVKSFPALVVVDLDNVAAPAEERTGDVDTTEADAALTELEISQQEAAAEARTAELTAKAEEIEADAIATLTGLESGQDPTLQLEALGNIAFDEGATDIKTFTERMKTKLGDLWEQFKEFIQAVFDKLKSERGAIEPFKKITVKRQVREVTGQVTEANLIREDKALARSLKRQEQAAKEATKEARKTILAEIDTIKERRKTIKQQIREFIGQVTEEPTVTESEALTESLRQQVKVGLKAQREGRREGVRRTTEQINRIRVQIAQEKTKVRIERETRRTVTQFVKDIIPLSEQGKFLKAIANARTPKQFGEVIERAQKFAEEFTEAELKKRLRSKIKKELKTTRAKKKGGKPVGKFTPEVQNTLDLLRNAAKLSTEEAEAKVAANLAQFPDTIPPDDVALENRVLSMVHGFDNRTSAELETLLQEIKDIKNEGRMINELKKFNRQAKIERAVGESVDVLSGGQGIPASISAGKQAAGIDISNRRNLFEKTTAWLNERGLWTQGWPDLFNKLSRLDPSKSVPGELTNPLEKFADVLKEENALKGGLRLNIIKIRDLYKKAYGIKADTTRKSDREMLKKMREDSKVIDLGVFEDLDGNQIHLKFTRAQLRKRYMEFQDPTLTDTFTEGMRYTNDMINVITETLTAQDKDFAQSELQFYQEYYEGVNNVYRDIYGVDLPFNEFYNPIRRELVKGQEDVTPTGGFGEFLQELNTRGSVTSKSFIGRVKNINPIMQQSDLAVFEQHLAEMERFKAWANKIRDFNAVFGDTEFKTAVELYHGKVFLGAINNFIADYTRGGVDLSGRLIWVDKLRGNISRSVLAIKPVIAIKQLISTVAYAESIPVAEFAKGELDFWKNPVENIKFIRKHSELMKSRGQNMERDVKTMLQSDEYHAYRAHPNFLNSLMLNVQLGDQGAIVAGGHAVIKYHMDKGKSIEEAIEIFERLTSSTQQSADLSLLSTLQRGGSFAKLFTQFMSSPNLYWRREAWALRNLMHGKIDKKQFTKTIMIYHVLIPMLFQWASDAFTWDEDEQLRAFLLGPLNGVFILGDMVEGIMRKALGLRRYDDEVPIMTIVDDAARGWDLWDWNNLTTEELWDAWRGLAGAVGKVKGIPLKTALDIGEGIDDVLTGNFEEGAIQTLGYSPTVAEKRTKKKKRSAF